MKKVIQFVLLMAATVTVFSQQALAAKVELEWTNVDGYTDLRTLDMRQEAFESMVFRELSQQFEDSADKFLGENQTLTITVSDLDLAGRVDYDLSNTQRQRVLKGHDFPAISFTYEVNDENGGLLSRGDENIKALNLKSVNRARYIGNDLHHERSLINDWFVEKF